MPEPSSAPPPVSTYLVPAILCTLCGCPATGIVALVFAARVNQKLQAGDYVGAVEASSQAKIWCWISAVLAVAGWVLVGGCAVLSQMAS